MYAVIETGGKQYRVEVGTELEVELLDVEPGQSITLERVLLVADGAEAAVGTPIVDGAAVEAEVLGATRGEKVIAFKYRPKARRRVKKGHRQELTVLRINDIRFGGKSAAEQAPKQTKAESRKALEEAAARQAADDAALAAKLNVASETVEPEVKAPRAKAEAKAKAEQAPVADAAPEPEATAPDSDATASTGSTKGFEIFEDGGEWRWRLVASNGEPVAVSEQGFSSKSSVVRTLDVVRRNVAEAEGHSEATDDDEDGPGLRDPRGRRRVALAPPGVERRDRRRVRTGLQQQVGCRPFARRRPPQRRGGRGSHGGRRDRDQQRRGAQALAHEEGRVAMAHKKAGSSVKNGRDSAGQRLGVKRGDGQVVNAGTIIVRQRGMTFKAGEGTGLGHDYTVFATVTGKVRFEHETRNKKRIRVIPVATEPATAEA